MDLQDTLCTFRQQKMATTTLKFTKKQQCFYCFITILQNECDDQEHDEEFANHENSNWICLLSNF